MLYSRVTFAHGPTPAASPIILNEHFNTDGTTDTQKVDDTIVIDRRQSDPMFRDSRDPYHLTQGGALGRVHKGMASWRLDGRILVPDATQQQRLSDRERDLRAAFDPFICTNDSPTTEGAFALKWDELTSDTTNFATGRRPVQLFCRPTLQPQVDALASESAMRRWALGLVAGDPRIYGQTEQTLVLTAGSPTNSASNIGLTAAPLKVTIVMSGNGNSAFRIARGGVTFEMNLTGMVNNDTIVVIMETSGPYGRGKLITKNGVENFALKTSAPNTWLNVPVGSTSFTITNTTGISTVTLAWYHAWA